MQLNIVVITPAWVLTASKQLTKKDRSRAKVVVAQIRESRGRLPTVISFCQSDSSVCLQRWRSGGHQNPVRWHATEALEEEQISVLCFLTHEEKHVLVEDADRREQMQNRFQIPTDPLTLGSYGSFHCCTDISVHTVYAKWHKSLTNLCWQFPNKYMNTTETPSI